ncbi:MAG: hotdog fold thioesterase [Flavobacteriales bacterium]|nr:hotdog fold thioesterase [Flavobacteriales bacterium]MCB9194103.1 hotdog fold thioesterase [Flavobacteriales bacterium]
MDAQERAERVVDRMYTHDPFSIWLGIERVQVAPGACVLRMRVREEMLNGFAIAHGGICYALADSALAFASNAHGIQAVSVETSITHTRRVNAGDVLTATTAEVSLGKRFATYHVRVADAGDRTVALFKGTVFRTGEEWTV